MKGPVADRYAQALFDLAADKKPLSKGQSMIDEVESELKTIKTILDDNPDLQKVLFHPQITPAAKQELLNQLFMGRISEVTRNFLALLVDRRRETYFDEIVDVFSTLANETRGVVEAMVTSAIELQDKEKSKLKSILGNLTGKKVRTSYLVDPSIIGGVVVRMGDKIIDGSIKTRLTTLKEQMKAIS